MQFLRLGFSKNNHIWISRIKSSICWKGLIFLDAKYSLNNFTAVIVVRFDICGIFILKKKD
jgi:hypothetical protein